MRYFLDTEFIEYPCTIDLISIGIVCEDGREYYAVNDECNYTKASDWVKENVFPKLVITSENLKDKNQIRDEIIQFVGDDMPEFWGYYADFDWVVFCWLFGSMMDLPAGWPMYCRDLKQILDSVKLRAPDQEDNQHNALADARWNKKVWEWLNELMGLWV